MEKKYWLGLNKIKGIGPIKMSKLLKAFNSPKNIWTASRKELKKVNGIGKLAKKIVDQRKKINLNTLTVKLKKKNISFKILNDKDYPELLKNIYDPPPVIYYKKKFNVNSPAIAVVGSRRCTKYGRRTARKISFELAQRGITVISGMARGIDSSAHKGAVDAGGKTVAVLGSGVDIIYPPENKNLYNEICENGAVISEFPPGIKPLSGNFPRRNRIISGLSLGTVVIEASKQSGSLITANLALEQGREVFAIPGNINRNSSKGTNNLIKSGAKIVTKTEDILEELYISQDNNSVSGKIQYPKLSKAEEKMINFFQKKNTFHINELIELSNMTGGDVNSILLKLELKGFIERKPGKKYSFKGLQNLLKPI